MRSSRALALALALGPAAAAAEAPAREVVERIVAVVDERPLLLSELRALMAVRGLPEPEALEAAIDERLMHLEAARLPQADVPPEEEDRALALLVETRGRLRVEVPEPDLRRLLRRQLAILKYVEFRFRPQVRVSDDEVRKAWEEEQAGNPAGPALEDAQDEIRQRLERRALDERIEAWVRELRVRADVRYVGSAAPGR
jgi:peptidyl-prolyl cis-trans isomerase SurA